MKNECFEADILVVPEIFQKLHVVKEGGESFLKGSLDVIDDTGEIWQTYEVEIKGGALYPSTFPKFYVRDNIFPKTADWHVYPSDLSCCVDVPMHEVIVCKNGLHVIDYIKRFAIPYLANQTFRIKEGYYLYGEYSHGFLGRLEFYQSKLKASSPQQLIGMFDYIINDFSPSRTATCPFCHKQKLRNCHRNVFNELASIKFFLMADRVELTSHLLLNPAFELPDILTPNSPG